MGGLAEHRGGGADEDGGFCEGFERLGNDVFVAFGCRLGVD